MEDDLVNHIKAVVVKLDEVIFIKVSPIGVGETCQLLCVVIFLSIVFGINPRGVYAEHE